MKDKAAWIVGIVGGVLAIAAYNPWHEFGWTTPHQHAKDVNDFRQEWRCDELSEEIDALLSLDDRTPLDNERLRRKRDAHDKNGCDAYENE